MKYAGNLLWKILLLAVIVAAIIEVQDPLQQNWKEMTDQIPGILLTSEQPKDGNKDEVGNTVCERELITEGTLTGGPSYYGYNLLSDSEKDIYCQFLLGVQQMDEEFEVDTKDAAVVAKAYDAILADRPELFWLGGYTIVSYMWGDKVTGLKIQPEYLYTEEEKKQREIEVEQVAKDIVNDISVMYSEPYGQVKAIYETIIQMSHYDLSASDNQNICSVFLNNRSVCMGYAKSFQYLAQKLGYECITVSGTANGDTHAWNLIFIDGAYYYMDATWGDMSYSEPDTGGEINYLYFGMTTQDLEKNHQSDMEMELPMCISEACNYYAREGLLYHGFDEEIVGGFIRENAAKGAPFVTFRFQSLEAYEQAKKYLFEESKVFDYCENVSDIRYMEYDDYFALTIYF